MSANFKKQFQRVTQRLDQTLGRSEKSEVLSQEQQNLDRRVDLIQRICQNVAKKVQACLISQGPLCDVEKRMKKIPKTGLSQTFIESSVQLGTDTGAGRAFQLCGDAEGSIAANTFQMELDVEGKVLQPLNYLLEVDVPSIQKLRKQLTSRTLDMDAARTRYSSTHRQLQQSGPNQGMQAKVDLAREEVEDAVAKVEQTRDQLATEMYAFVAKESDISQYLLDLIQIEVEYHRQALESLEKIIPQLKESIELSVVLPVFGLGLKEHLDNSGREIAVVLEECIMALYSADYNGLEEEGLFRIAGGASKMKKLRAVFNSNTGPVCFAPEEFHSHVISSVLKQYLRELPEPLMRSDLYSEWMQAAQKSGDQRLGAITNVLTKMPTEHKRNLGYLIKFLAKLSEYADVNKMSASNIALVIGPNLLWATNETSANMLTNTGVQTSLVETLIVNADYFFPGQIDFSVPQPVVTPVPRGSFTPFSTSQSSSANGTAGSSDAAPPTPTSAKASQLLKRQPKPTSDLSVRPTSWTPPDNERLPTGDSTVSPRLDRPKIAPPDRPGAAPAVPEKPVAPALPEKPLKPSRETTPVPAASRPPELPEKPSKQVLENSAGVVKSHPSGPSHLAHDSPETAGKIFTREGSVGKLVRPPRPQLPPHPRTGKAGDSDDSTSKKEPIASVGKGLPPLETPAK